MPNIFELGMFPQASKSSTESLRKETEREINPTPEEIEQAKKLYEEIDQEEYPGKKFFIIQNLRGKEKKIFELLGYDEKIVRKILDDPFGNDYTFLDGFSYIRDKKYGKAVLETALKNNVTLATHENLGMNFLKEYSEDEVVKKIIKMRSEIKEDDNYFLTKRTLCFFPKVLKGEMSTEKAQNMSRNDKKFFNYASLLYLKSEKYPYTYIPKRSFEGELNIIAGINVNEMNRLHNRAGEERFKSLHGASPEKLFAYTILQGNQMYTSTFNEIIDRFENSVGGKNINKFLSEVDRDKKLNFVHSLNWRGKGDILTENLNESEMNELLKDAIKDIDKHEDVRKSVIYTADLIKMSTIDIKQKEVIARVLEKEYKERRNTSDTRGQKIYGVLGSYAGNTFGLENPWIQKMTKEYPLPVPVEKISKEKLFNKEGKNIQFHIFYDDRKGEKDWRVWDGHLNFKHFLEWNGFNAEFDERGKFLPIVPIKNHKEDTKNVVSTVEDKGKFIVLKKNFFVNGEKKEILMLANKPDFGTDGLPLMEEFLAKEKIEKVHLAAHHGHSYHTNNTLSGIKNNPAIAKADIISLGSCGDFARSEEVFDINLYASIIANKYIGKRNINDKILNAINETIMNSDKKEIDWPQIQRELSEKIKDRDFISYIFPHQNVVSWFKDVEVK